LLAKGRCLEQASSSAGNNRDSVWPTTTCGLSSPAEREGQTGESAFLDAVTQAARESRPKGGRFQVQADGAYWLTTGRKFIVWEWVHPDAIR
jgi:hypothetical protein